MISKETLEAVRVGILTNNQLDEAIEHYTILEDNLRCHGEVYHLVWRDVFMTLKTLNEFNESRKRSAIEREQRKQ